MLPYICITQAQLAQDCLSIMLTTWATAYSKGMSVPWSRGSFTFQFTTRPPYSSKDSRKLGRLSWCALSFITRNCDMPLNVLSQTGLIEKGLRMSCEKANLLQGFTGLQV